MLISNIQTECQGDHQYVQARIGPYPLWFRHNGPAAESPMDASAFLVSALIPAMLLGENIAVDEDYFVSPRLLAALSNAQTLINHWNPVFKPVSISARSEEKRTDNIGGASFFSAGVDSLYTALKHDQELDALILINGFDFDMDKSVWADMVARNTAIAHDLDKRLVLVETNLREFNAWFRLSRYANFGASLATVANLLRYKTVYISGHGTYDKLLPAGAHPLLDPLWSTENCIIHHVGLEADRAEKILYLKEAPELLSQLWVCWNDPKTNCGRCSKCLRSYIAMQLCQVDNFNFQQSVNLDHLRKLVIEDEENFLFFENFRERARHNNCAELTRVIDRLILKYKFKHFLLDVDKYLFKSKFKGMKNRGRTAIGDLADISVLQRETDQSMLEALLAEHRGRQEESSTRIIGSVFDSS